MNHWDWLQICGMFWTSPTLLYCYLFPVCSEQNPFYCSKSKTRQKTLNPYMQLITLRSVFPFVCILLNEKTRFNFCNIAIKNFTDGSYRINILQVQRRTLKRKYVPVALVTALFIWVLHAGDLRINLICWEGRQKRSTQIKLPCFCFFALLVCPVVNTC